MGWRYTLDGIPRSGKEPVLVVPKRDNVLPPWPEIAYWLEPHGWVFNALDGTFHKDDEIVCWQPIEMPKDK